MNTQRETIYEDQRGRMKLKIVRRNGKYGARYSTLIYRPYKIGESADSEAVWTETHWLDEQDVLNSLRLHEIADEFIGKAKRQSTDVEAA